MHKRVLLNIYVGGEAYRIIVNEAEYKDFVEAFHNDVASNTIVVVGELNDNERTSAEFCFRKEKIDGYLAYDVRCN